MSFIYAAICANAIVGIFGVTKLLHHFGFQFSVSQLKKMLLFSIPGIPTHLSYWIKECMDRIFLAGSGSLQNTGIYQIALSYCNVLNFGIEAFYNANSPRFVALIQNNEDNENKIISMLPVSIAFFSILAFGISLSPRF
jgi:O-antigen/teichoic acid export membrane protein